MPELLPFEALRYAGPAGRPADLLAPPYDVIAEEEAEDLRRRGPYNAVRLVLPEGDPPARYATAAARLRGWLEQGVLVEDAEPAAYVYRQTFDSRGERLSRWSLLAALPLSRFGAREVLPHEETHAGPKRDRLALTLACRAQLSAVFLSAADPDGRLLDRLAGTAGGAPVLEAETPDGVGHVLWRVRGEEARRLCTAAGRDPLLIADGHHRYETALAVRRRLPGSERARAVLVCVASEVDPGLRAYPTHRTVGAAPAAGSWTRALAERFELERVGGAGAEALVERVARSAGSSGPSPLGLFLPSRRDPLLLRPRPGALEAAGSRADEARIGSLVFDRLILRGTLGLTAEEATARRILSYHRDPVAAAGSAGERGAAFLLPPVGLAEVRAVAASGRRLPPKSTYFAPKIPSGLLFRRI